MAEGDTHKLTPFETLVLQRFDQIDARLTNVEAGQSETNARLTKVEAGQSETNERLDKLEAKTFDTKPIWTQVLADLQEVKQEVRAGLQNLERKMRALNDDVLQVRADLRGFDERIVALEELRKS